MRALALIGLFCAALTALGSCVPPEKVDERAPAPPWGGPAIRISVPASVAYGALADVSLTVENTGLDPIAVIGATLATGPQNAIVSEAPAEVKARRIGPRAL